MFTNFPSKIDPKKGYRYLNGHQFRAELDKCLQCPEKPCNQECPCKVDPSEFINAAYSGEKSDMDYAALCIYSKQPLGSVCGVICPVNHCMSRCSRQKLDASINIPALQAEIIKRACKDGKFRELIKKSPATGKHVAVVGAGPSGLSAATCLASRGHKVTIFEKNAVVGGDVQLIPKYRFPDDVLKMDLDLLSMVGDTEIKLNTPFDPATEKDYDAVIYAVGSQNHGKLTCPGAEFAISTHEFFAMKPEDLKGKSIGVFGCGGVAVDVALAAQKAGASCVIFYRRTLDQAPLAPEERGAMAGLGVSVVPRVGIEKVIKEENGKLTVHCVQFDAQLNPTPDTDVMWKDLDYLVPALGQRTNIKDGTEQGKVFVCGQARGKNTSAVQASASGKNAAWRCHNFLTGQQPPKIDNDLISNFTSFEYEHRPADIKVSLDGKKVTESPFIAGASSFTENLYTCKKYLQKGWGGVVIGIGEYANRPRTYMKGKPMDFHSHVPADEALKMVNELRKEFPNSILGVQILASSETLENDFKFLTSAVDFVEVTCDSTDEYMKAKKLGGNSLIILNGHCESAQIHYGAKNKRDALNAFARGYSVCVVEPSDIKRTGQGIEHLNTQLSFAIWRDGFKNIKEWAAQNKSFDIESIGEEPLINHLVNPYTCIGCGRCTMCPNDAITLIPAKWVYKVDPDKCNGCGLCESVCPTASCALITREKARELSSKKHNW